MKINELLATTKDIFYDEISVMSESEECEEPGVAWVKYPEDLPPHVGDLEVKSWTVKVFEKGLLDYITINLIIFVA